MTDILFLLHESSIADPSQVGICFQETRDAFCPIGHHQITDQIPKIGEEDLLSALGKLPVNAPGRIDPERASSFRILLSKQVRGVYFPRIDRPILGESEHLHGQKIRAVINASALQGARKQFDILKDALEDIFRCVHPCVENYHVYGHAIRNLLMLAATEVESAFVAVLRANNIDPIANHYSTKDYVRLLKVMQLGIYEVRLREYPCLPALRPFKDWDCNKPTQSLVWYDHYNKVKHNREANLTHAKLEYAVNAIAAAHVMNMAQFAERNVYDPYFEVQQIPRWDRGELYIPPAGGEEWKVGSVNA